MSVSIFLNLLLFILFLTVLGPPRCVWFSLVAGTGDYSLLLHGLLIVVVSLVVEHGLWCVGFRNGGACAYLLHSMWDLPRPGTEPVSPALAGRFITMRLPGKSLH